MNKSASLWPLRLLALAIAIVLWLLYSYSGREQTLSERALTNVPVTYNTPQGHLLLNPTSELSIRVSGIEEAVLDLSPFQVSALVELPASPGIHEIVLEGGNISRPQGINVISIVPDRLSLELDVEVKKTLRVRPVLQGEPAAGAVEGEHRVVPEFVDVHGPRSLLARQDTVDARVDIDGRARSFDQSVTIDTTSPLIQVLGSSTARVSVRLDPPTLSSAAGNGVNGAAEQPAESP